VGRERATGELQAQVVVEQVAGRLLEGVERRDDELYFV